MNKKVYEIITNQILEQLEKGVVPWRKPWVCGGWPRNFKTKKPYRGINVAILGSKEYVSPYWLTFKQIGEFGGKVKKGEKGTIIVFWKLMEVKNENDDEANEKENRYIPLLRYYRVWNLEQTEGIDYEIEPVIKSEAELLNDAEEIINYMPNRPEIIFRGSRAYYKPSIDKIFLPERKYFKTTGGYYGTVFHELAHSTGHKSRLDRPGIANFDGFATEQYSKEELVAEMTAAFLLGHIGFQEGSEIENMAAYIGGWLKSLKDDPRLVVQAAAQAQKAADYILNVKTEDEAEDDEE